MKIERRGIGVSMSFEEFMEMYGLTLVITGKYNKGLHHEATLEYDGLQFYKAKMDGSKLAGLAGTGTTEEDAIKDLVRQLDRSCIAINRYKIILPKLRSG